MKILVVDDSGTTRKIIIKHLATIGLTDIVEAENGVDALKKLESFPEIEVVLSDWNMPEMTGIAFLEKFRANAGNASKPFIMVTTEAEKTAVVQALKLGANNYILKPFTAESLIEKLKQTLQKFGKSV